MVGEGQPDEGQPDEGQLDELLASASVLLVIGAGGVGKTTISAALGCRAAAVHGRRVLVVTIDPARRLADALGIGGVPTEPVLVPVGEGDGRLWASMVDMAQSWDELVERLASPDDAEALLANPLYRTLTTRFIQSHDYIALDHLSDLSDGGAYDLVLIDTPPSTHAIDILDAPDRMIEFFGSRLLRWLTAPYRSRLVQTTSRPFLAVAERLLGGPFLARIAEFFWLFSRLQPGFVVRADEVKRRLDDSSTGYVVVTSSDPSAVAQTRSLLDALSNRDHQASLLIHNRAVPELGADLGNTGETSDAGDLDAIDDASLRHAMASLLDRDRRLVESLAVGSRSCPLVTVPWTSGELTSVSELGSLFG